MTGQNWKRQPAATVSAFLAVAFRDLNVQIPKLRRRWELFYAPLSAESLVWLASRAYWPSPGAGD